MPGESNIANIFIDIIPDMCFVVSSEKMVLVYNKRVRELLGLPESPEAPISFYSLLTPDSPRPLLPVLLTGTNAREAEVRFKAADGGVIDALLFIRRIQGVGAEFLYVIARDVSESKKKELDLLRFSNVVHYTVNPIQITDSRGRMVYVNPAFEKTTGYGKDELIGVNPSQISSGKHPKEFWKNVWNTITSGQVWTGEVENRRKDGTPIFTDLLISPIVDAEGTVVGFLGAHHDITERRQLEQQLMHSQKMESIGTLAAGIAHEVGNPLASISSIVQVLLRTLSDDPVKEKLSMVQSQVHRITKIIRDLVDFSRPSNYQVHPTDLVRVLADAVEIVKMGKKAKDITFVTHVRRQIPSLPLVPDQISQVFINILLNAVDALQGKHGTITSEVGRDDGVVRVTISDDGTGIKPEHMRKIFEPFFTTKHVGEGTGLGLWVSYGIVRNFEGDLRVSSVWGKGTSFIMTLPLNGKE
jgi:PAS domain S-box-containing protein